MEQIVEAHSKGVTEQGVVLEDTVRLCYYLKKSTSFWNPAKIAAEGCKTFGSSMRCGTGVFNRGGATGNYE